MLKLLDFCGVLFALQIDCAKADHRPDVVQKWECLFTRIAWFDVACISQEFELLYNAVGITGCECAIELSIWKQVDNWLNQTKSLHVSKVW